jgi:hypothetical protein
VVDELLAWAERRELEVRQHGDPGFTLLDHDLPRSLDPVLTLRMRYFDRAVAPQWLVAVNAVDGTLSVLFQYMNHPPFSTPEGREPLRTLLNQIDGVAIPAVRLRGRPRIPLELLASSDALGRLLSVLDIVTAGTQPGS